MIAGTLHLPNRGSCITGKHSYPSHSAALRSAGMQLGKRRVQLRVYRCTECWLWHLSGVREKRRIGVAH